MKKMYSINDIAAQLGLPCHEAPGPRGNSLEYDWNIAAADEMVKLLLADGAEEITLDGHPQAWLACYLALKLRPRTVGLFIPPMGGDIPMIPLSFGQENPQGHVNFQVEPFQDGVLLHFEPDSRDYEAAAIHHVVIPEAVKGKHVYLQGMAPNFITGSLALTLADACPSVSVSGQDGGFTCVASQEAARKPGDITARRPMAMPGGPKPPAGGPTPPAGGMPPMPPQGGKPMPPR